MKTYYLCGLCLLVTACGQIRHTSNISETGYSNSTQSKASVMPATKNSMASFDKLQPYAHSQDVFCSPLISVDTVINRFHIRYKWMPNKDVIQRTTRVEEGDNIRESLHKYADNSLYVDAEYDGHKIISVKEIDKIKLKSILSSPAEIGDYQIHQPFIESVTDTTFTLSFGLFIPDTDIGCMIELVLASDGSIVLSEMETNDFEEY